MAHRHTQKPSSYLYLMNNIIAVDSTHMALNKIMNNKIKFKLYGRKKFSPQSVSDNAKSQGNGNWKGNEGLWGEGGGETVTVILAMHSILATFIYECQQEWRPKKPLRRRGDAKHSTLISYFLYARNNFKWQTHIQLKWRSLWIS